MDKKVMTVCLVLGFLGLLSAALGFAAEGTRIKKNQIIYETPSKCIYPQSPAHTLALAAAVALVIAHAITNILTGCLCEIYSDQATYQQTVALLCYIISWFTCCIGSYMLFPKDEKRESVNIHNKHFCHYTKPGTFAIAATLSLVTVVLDILSYAIVESSKNVKEPVQVAIAMGQPVFVHQGTYTRRQLV